MQFSTFLYGFGLVETSPTNKKIDVHFHFLNKSLKIIKNTENKLNALPYALLRLLETTQKLFVVRLQDCLGCRDPRPTLT